MERQLKEIVEKHLEGNYLVGSENKAKMISAILDLFSVRVMCPECNEPYITYTEHEYYQCNSCDHEWI